MAEQVQHGAVEGVFDETHAKQVVAKRQALVAELVGLGSTMCAAMDAMPGFVPCGHAFGVVLDGLTASAAATDLAAISEVTDDVRARSEHVAEHRDVPQGKVVNVCEGASAAASQALALTQAAALAAVPAMRAGLMSDELDVALVRALESLGKGDAASAQASAASALALASTLL